MGSAGGVVVRHGGADMRAQRRLDTRRAETHDKECEQIKKAREVKIDQRQDEKTVQDRRNDVPWTDWEI